MVESKKMNATEKMAFKLMLSLEVEDSTPYLKINSFSGKNTNKELEQYRRYLRWTIVPSTHL